MKSQLRLAEAAAPDDDGRLDEVFAALSDPVRRAILGRLDGRVLLAGSDLADGWAGFIDGAIESGLRAGRRAAELSG